MPSAAAPQDRRRSPTYARRLSNLGYADGEIREALRELPPGDNASALLRDALKLLGARRAG